MTRLLRLYPRAWRARYGAELASIVEAGPLTLGDRFDLIRGAVDAHLHPELVALNADQPFRRSGSAIAALLIGLGSAAWLAGVASVGSQPLGFGDRDTRMIGLLLPVGGVLFALGVAWVDRSLGRIRPLGILMTAAFAVAIVPMTWPIVVIGFHGVTFTLAGIAFARAAAGQWPGWIAAAIAIAALAGLGTNVDSNGVWFAILPAVAMTTLAILTCFGRLTPAGSRNLAPNESGA